MTPDEYPLVEIEWIDADLDFDATGTPSDMSDFDESPPLVRDAGYLVLYDREKFVLATSFLPENDQLRHRNTIPTSLVRSITFTEPGKCLKTAELLRKARTSTATSTKTSRAGSANGSESSSPSTTAPSTTRSPREPSP